MTKTKAPLTTAVLHEMPGSIGLTAEGEESFEQSVLEHLVPARVVEDGE